MAHNPPAFKHLAAVTSFHIVSPSQASSTGVRAVNSAGEVQGEELREPSVTREAQVLLADHELSQHAQTFQTDRQCCMMPS